jgi:peroxiredoxin
MAERVNKEAGASPGFPLLSDADFKVINRYGIYNPDGFQGRKVPHPAVYVVDRSGKVTWKFLDTNAQHRAENADIIKALDDLDKK